MSTPSQRLAELGIELPPVAAPVGSYVPATRLGDTVQTSGQIPYTPDGLVTGIVGSETDAAAAQAAARVAALNALAAAAEVAGGVDALRGIARVTVFVASAPGFTEQAAVANGASDVLAEIFGADGCHIRSAVGVAVLPKNASVEVELVARV